MNLEKAYCIKLSSLVNRLFLCIGGIFGVGYNSLYLSFWRKIQQVGKIGEVEKYIPS